MKKNNSRTKKSFKNMVASVTANIVAIAIGFFARSAFIKILGNEYNGLNGLFTNIISLLSIVELGIGNAIIYNLYKPIAENDQKTIKTLMRFYKKSYHIIGIIVGFLGIGIIPFLSMITGTVTVKINITIVYLLFLSDTIFSYFLSYKRSILYANQENYYISVTDIFYQITMNFLQISILYLTKNFYIYLIIKIIMRIVENIVITYIANSKYPYLKEKNIEKLDKNIEKDIFKKIKALFFHQIGGFIINGTDNIIISKFFGLIVVGLYSNYYLIINSVQTIAKQIIQATTPSIGNMLVTETQERQFEIFKKIRFINFWIAAFCGTCIFVLMKPFIIIWIGQENLLSTITLVVLTFNFYQKTSRFTYASFKNAAGIFHEDRFIPIIESITNIIASIILLKIVGLPGVFLGTIVSGLCLWCYSYPKFVYKKLFNKNYKAYISETIGYIFLFCVILSTTYFITNISSYSNVLIELVLKSIICLIIPNIIIVICFYKTDNLRYYAKLIKKLPIFKKEAKK